LCNARHVIFAHPVAQGVGWKKDHKDCGKYTAKDIEDYALRSVRTFNHASKIDVYRFCTRGTIQEPLLKLLKNQRTAEEKRLTKQSSPRGQGSDAKRVGLCAHERDFDDDKFSKPRPRPRAAQRS